MTLHKDFELYIIYTYVENYIKTVKK